MTADSGPAFVDTNILVYAYTWTDPVRGPIARKLVESLMVSSQLRTSAQVLQELYVTLTSKGRNPVVPGDARYHLDQLAEWPVFSPDYSAIREAVDLSITDSFSFWDSLIIVAAARSWASVLFSEDMQHGRIVKGVRIENPFVTIQPH